MCGISAAGRARALSSRAVALCVLACLGAAAPSSEIALAVWLHRTCVGVLFYLCSGCGSIHAASWPW